MSTPHDGSEVRVDRLDLAETLDYIGQDIRERGIHVPPEVAAAHSRLTGRLRD